MTNDEGMTISKPQTKTPNARSVFETTGFVRHWSLVLRHFQVRVHSRDLRETNALEF